jgi:5-methylcytosine-specific restriction endonuclease McrA
MSWEMKAMKNYLFDKYGLRCEVCGKEFSTAELTAHHIIMKCKGGKITEDNILIACYNCHFGRINHIEYDSDEYWELMKKSLEHRKEK